VVIEASVADVLKGLGFPEDQQRGGEFFGAADARPG
jgi:hypothetical protein